KTYLNYKDTSILPIIQLSTRFFTFFFNAFTLLNLPLMIFEPSPLPSFLEHPPLLFQSPLSLPAVFLYCRSANIQ
ncbi:MAG: hypothetical protein K2H35_05775, partial [Muribaculaceae bacterium]|nr:hypothetical protein [Muribaculaceae bacterium]